VYHFYFTFRSVTAAQQAEKIITESGLRGTLLRTPKILSAKGCGYAVRVPASHGKSVTELLRRHGISHQGIYRVFQNGKTEAVAP